MSNPTNHGPFRDLQVPDELYSLHGTDEDGTAYQRLPYSIATNLFLTVFKPTDGWGVEIQSQVMEFDMRPLVDRNNPDSQFCATAQFVASLVNAEGKIICQASTVWVLAGATDWERGETNARQRLYAALGLQITQYDRQQSTTTAPTRPALSSVKPCESSIPERFRSKSQEPSAGTADITKNGDASDPKPKAKASQHDETQGKLDVESSQSDTPSSPDTKPAQVSKGKDKRQRTSDDAPPNASLLSTIKTTAALRNIPVPDLSTKGEAKAFLKQLNEG